MVKPTLDPPIVHRSSFIFHLSSFVKPALLHHFAVCAQTFRHPCLNRQLLGAARHCIKGARAVADALLIHDLSTRTL